MTVSWKTLANDVRSRVAAQVVASPYASLVVQYDNAPSVTLPDNDLWMRATLLPGDTFQASRGAATKQFRTAGVLMMQIFAPAASGDAAALALADHAASKFRSVTASGVTYQSPSVEQVGLRDGWWQVNVSCPFYHDDFE